MLLCLPSLKASRWEKWKRYLCSHCLRKQILLWSACFVISSISLCINQKQHLGGMSMLTVHILVATEYGREGADFWYFTSLTIDAEQAAWSCTGTLAPFIFLIFKKSTFSFSHCSEQETCTFLLYFFCIFLHLLSQPRPLAENNLTLPVSTLICWAIWNPRVKLLFPSATANSDSKL